MSNAAGVDRSPKPLLANGLRIIPLGGVGEIGRNMTVFEYDGKLLIVDCGVLFPEEDQPGVDLILPDFSYLRGRADDIVGVVLTHGHEDHIGGLPYLLREHQGLPLIGSTFTLALVEAKLREHRIKPYTLPVAEGRRETLGPFECEFFAVNHSIPDALAVAIRTGAGLVLHTGDFKMDQLPLDGRLTDLGGFARLGSEGVDLLMSDSTNAEVPGFVTSERRIGPVLDQVVRDAKSKVVVACFSSHVHRVQQVLDAAQRHGRKVAFVGRSMVRNMGVARDLGLLTIPDRLLVSMDVITSLPPREVVLISTGSQGEPLSALARMANREHHQVRIEADDTVILASSLVPGNESAVYKVINGLARYGATVVHKEVAMVHVSGHSPAGELLYVLNATRPSNMMPVHGEWRHLRAHGKLAEATGVPAERVVLAEDGFVIDLVDGIASIAGKVDCGFVYVDGLEVGDVGESTLRDRRILGDDGFIAITVAIDSVTGKVTGEPHVSGRGFSDEPDAFEPVLPLIEAELARATAEGVSSNHQLAQQVRRVVGKWVADTYRRRPMIVPTVISV